MAPCVGTAASAVAEGELPRRLFLAALLAIGIDAIGELLADKDVALPVPVAQGLK
jgi:hypothetical protein